MRCDGTRRALTERLAVVVRDLRRRPREAKGGWKWRKSPAQCAITSRVPISEKYLLARNVLRDNYGRSNTRIAGRVSLGSRRKG